MRIAPADARNVAGGSGPRERHTWSGRPLHTPAAVLRAAPAAESPPVAKPSADRHAARRSAAASSRPDARIVAVSWGGSGACKGCAAPAPDPCARWPLGLAPSLSSFRCSSLLSGLHRPCFCTKKKTKPRTLEKQRKAVSHCGTARCSDRGALLRRDGGGRGSAGGLDVPQGPRHQLYVLLSRGDGRVAMGKAPAGRRAQARGAVGRADAGAAGAFARAPPPQRIAHAQAFARPARPRERARAPRCATPPARFRA